ncbi:hypothetical protein AK812_SmicGene8489 [Symbiodinium microadriaticum]|uniref:Uncharacterized protein n=1 Tax=Symbiodinium microadriaticum TaxID=2951 RepID=A0A1Q9EKR7_SYMMI|nr:hypothetical protein AK812_SmicGene8489 [Symbiodinium microadriaticum]
MTKRGSGESSGEKETRAVQQLPKVLALDETDPGEKLHGTWASEKGTCTIGKDPVTARLSYTEPVGEGERVHGWLDAAEESVWQGSLVLLKAGQGPWYGPSFGPAPEVVGDIKVTLHSGEKPYLETQIRMADEEDQGWSEPTKFELQDAHKNGRRASAFSLISRVGWREGTGHAETGSQRLR